MQDAENIFELAPADRLTVLKHVFGLLGIDEAKDHIQEKKRILTAEKKVLSDTTSFDEKCTMLIKTYLQNTHILNTHALTKDHLSPRTDIISELTNVQDKVTIQSMTVDHLPLDMYTTVYDLYNHQKQATIQQDTRVQNLQSQYQEYLTQNKQQQTDITNRTRQIEQINTQLQTHKTINTDELKHNKQQLLQQQSAYIQEFPTQKISALYEKQSNTRIAKESPSTITAESGMASCMQFLHHCIQLGSLLKQENETLQTKIQAHTDKIKQDTAYIDLQIQKWKEKDLDYQQQKIVIDEQLANISQSLDQQSNFFCSKIDTSCPFIQTINKQSLEQIQQQKSQREAKLSQRQKNYDAENIPAQITKLEKEKENLSISSAETQGNTSQELEKNIKENTALLEIIKDFFTTHKRKEIQETYTAYQDVNKQLESTQKQLDSIESQEAAI